MKPKTLTVADLRGAEATAGAVAGLLGLSERRIRQLAERGVLDRTPRGHYVLADAIAAYAGFLRQGADAAGGTPAGEDYATARARHESAKATMAEIELAKARGEVVPIEDVERAWSRAFAELRTNILNVPGRAFRQLVGETNEQRFKGALRAELSAALEATAQADMVDDEPDDADADEDE